MGQGGLVYKLTLDSSLVGMPSDPAGRIAPESELLVRNYPNPFNPRTTFRCYLPQAGRTRLTVYDVNGRRVARLLDENLLRGWHQMQWKATDGAGRPLPSGLYLYRLTCGKHQATGKLLLVR